MLALMPTYVANPQVISMLLEEWAEVRPMWTYSADLPDAFFPALIELARKLDAKPIDLAGCWLSESDLRPTAHNHGGNAVGVFQAMPNTLKGLRFLGNWDDFAKLSATEQLYWAEKYYMPHRGHLVTPGACYLATFLPALLSHAGSPAFILCGKEGPFKFAYAPNALAFDPEKKGHITVGDLDARIARVTKGPRWGEIVARIKAAEQNRDTDPELRMPVAFDVTCVEGQQGAFNRLGYDCGDVDGIYGKRTKEACMDFQYDKMLCVDGVCGPKTQQELRLALLTAE